MSQALFEKSSSDRHEAQSAGTTPAGRIHPSVVTVMEEEGIDVSRRVPRLLTDDLARWADVVITMGCGDSCPVIPGKRYVDWDLRDPKDLPLDEVRAIRDDIKGRVADLVKDLDRARIPG
jgi:arsenate reductase